MTSTPDQVLSVLKLLAEYYNHEPTETQASIYLDALSDLDPVPLQESARRWIRRSPFFPKVSDLLQIARQIPSPAPDALAYRVQALEDAFYAEGRLDPAEWERLAVQFEQLDRPHRAASTRGKLRSLQTILDNQAAQAALPATTPSVVATSVAPPPGPAPLHRPQTLP